MRIRLTILGGLWLALAVGCARDPSLHTPQLAGPGTTADQQRNAVRYDPYPEREPGPSMTGTRPRDYDRPIPEVDRSRWTVPVNPANAAAAR